MLWLPHVSITSATEPAILHPVQVCPQPRLGSNYFLSCSLNLTFPTGDHVAAGMHHLHHCFFSRSSDRGYSSPQPLSVPDSFANVGYTVLWEVKNASRRQAGTAIMSGLEGRATRSHEESIPDPGEPKAVSSGALRHPKRCSHRQQRQP